MRIPTNFLLDLVHFKANKCHKLICFIIRIPDFDLDDHDVNGCTALMYAAKGDHEWLVRYLIQHGASIDTVSRTQYKDTALTWSVYLGSLQSMYALVELGANINHQTACKKKSLLMWALSQNYVEIFEYLLYAGCDHMLMNTNGETIHDLCKKSTWRYIISKYKSEIHESLKDSLPTTFEIGISDIILGFMI